MNGSGAKTNLPFELFGRQGAVEPLEARVEDGVGARLAVVWLPAPHVHVDHVRHGHDEVDGAELQFNEQAPQDEPQQALEGGRQTEPGRCRNSSSS